MILMYHKVDLITPTVWWVSAATFAKHMDALRDREVVYLADYDPYSDRQTVITFDDAYENIHRHALEILKDHRFPFEVFINGDFLGRWNHADPAEPLTRYCGLEQLEELAFHGGRIQWHTRTHANLTTLDTAEVAYQISVPVELSCRFPKPHLTWFAYPFGAQSPLVIEAVRRQFDGAVSVLNRNATDIHQLNRLVATENLVLADLVCDQDRASAEPDGQQGDASRRMRVRWGLLRELVTSNLGYSGRIGSRAPHSIAAGTLAPESTSYPNGEIGVSVRRRLTRDE
jgi:peptidoglycan/xylan/chitin deacetylase (PgdA/CDA1 family)